MSFLLRPYLAPSKWCNVTPWGRPSVGVRRWTSAPTNATNIEIGECERKEGGKQKERITPPPSPPSLTPLSGSWLRVTNLCTAAKENSITTYTLALSIFEAIRPHLLSPDMITDEHYICFQLTKHGHRCGIASQWAALRGRGVADDKSALRASKYGQIYIWNAWKGVSFRTTWHNVKPPSPNKWPNNKKFVSGFFLFIYFFSERLFYTEKRLKVQFLWIGSFCFQFEWTLARSSD